MQTKRKYTVVGISNKAAYRLVQLKNDNPLEEATLVLDYGFSCAGLPEDIKDGSSLTITFTSARPKPDTVIFWGELHKTEDFYTSEEAAKPNLIEVQATLVLKNPRETHGYAGLIKLIVGKRAHRKWKKDLQPGIAVTLTFE